MWDWAIRGALILGGAAGIGSVSLLVVRAREGWRRFKHARTTVLDDLDRLAGKGNAAAERLAAAGDTAELEESLGRLRVSLARLAVLREAIDEVRDTFGRVTAFVPHK